MRIIETSRGYIISTTQSLVPTHLGTEIVIVTSRYLPTHNTQFNLSRYCRLPFYFIGEGECQKKKRPVLTLCASGNSTRSEV